MRLLLLSTLVASATAAAETPVPSIDEARLLAKLAGDPRLARIAAEIELARAAVAEARVAPNPTISVEREEVFPDGGLATSYLRLAVPLELSGRRSLRTRAAEAGVAAATVEAERARLAVTVAALRVFRTAAYRRLRIELLRGERGALASAVDVVRKRSATGAASGYDLQRIELELGAYDDLAAAAEAELAAARAELGAWIGAPQSDAADALALPAEPPPLAALVESALAQHPDLRAAQTRLAGARVLGRAASRAWIPELALSGGAIQQDLDASTTARGYTAGVSLSLPLFEHGQVDRARATAQARAAAADRDVLALTLPAAIRAAHATFARTLARARTVQQGQLSRLDQLLRSAETAYRDGGGNVVELLDAHKAARDTRLRELELRRDARLAELDLWLALGRRP